MRLVSHQQLKKCPKCGSLAYLDAQQCTGCGHVFRTNFGTAVNQTQVIQPQAPQVHHHYHAGGGASGQMVQRAPGAHSVALAALFSLCCLTGVAQVYNGQVMKGLMLFAFVVIVGAFLGAIGGIFIAIVIGMMASIDGIMIAIKLNRGQPVGQWEFF